jgi:hypothetical protein
LTALVAVGFMAAVSLCAGACSSSGDAGREPVEAATATPSIPAEFPEPDAVVRSATEIYLAGTGGRLLAMHWASVGFARDPSGENCTATISELDATVSADDASDLIAGIADPVLRDAMNQERTVLGVALTTCATPPASVPFAGLDELTEASGLVTSRLYQLEIAS